MDPEPVTLNDIDTSRALRTRDELERLVAAIYGSPPGAQETNWLEWKSGLDLTKAAGKFVVAKTILGFANRSVAQAQLACEGVAYMAVGVEPGTAAGVGAIDHADLGLGIKTYTNGTRWTPFYVTFSGVTVLVVVVESPRRGDPIHPLRKAYEGHHRGTVFHRGTAQTEPAGPEELDMLGERILQGVRQPELDLTLLCAAEPLRRLNIGRAQVEEWLSRHEVYVRATSGQPPAPVPIGGGSALSSLFAGDTGLGSLHRLVDSNAAVFDQRVKTYLAKLGRVLPSHVLRAIVRDAGANTVYFQVGNETEDPVSAVQLSVRIRKDRLQVYSTPPRVDSWPEKPKWPDALDRFRAANKARLSASVEDLIPITHRSGSVTDVGDAFEVTWDVGDLRPGEWSRELDITVIVGPATVGELDADLVARAMDRRGQAASTGTLTVSADECAIDDFYMAEPS